MFGTTARIQRAGLGGEGLAHAHNVRVVQPGKQLRFFHEALDGVRVIRFRVIILQRVQGVRREVAVHVREGHILLNHHLLMALLMFRKVSNAEATLADFVQQAVAL